MIGIYKITSPSGKVYIGQSWDIINRKSYYRNYYCKGQRRLYNSFIKYGFEHHVFETQVVFSDGVSQVTLDSYEIFFIEQLREGGFKLLNLKTGGRGGKHSEETKLLISSKHKGKKSWLGKKHSQATKDKMGKYRIGTKLSPECLEKLRIASTGNKYSLGFKHTIETRMKKYKPVIQIKNGIIIKKFINSKAASDFFGLKSHTSIHNVLRGIRRNARGFQWDYESNSYKYKVV